jgi:predicted esterase
MKSRDIQFESDLSKYPILDKFPSNKSFDLKLWGPNKNSDTRTAEITIIINGFMEGVSLNGSTPSRKLYESIASELNKNNISAIHYPLPFHFERSKESNPIDRLKLNGNFLYYGGFSLVIEDLEKLVQDIIDNHNKYGLNENPKIHLLGYSLGGIAAVGVASELARRNSDFRFSSLSILLSALNLNNVNPDNISLAFRNTITAEDWQRVMSDLERVKNDPSVSPIFKYLIWEIGEPIQFSKLAEKVLLLHGHNDEIFSADDAGRLQRLVLDEMNQCTFINVPSKHAVHFDREIIARYISNFIISDFKSR